MSIKTPGPLCPLGPLLTRMIGNTPNAQNLGGSEFETCLCFFSRKSSSPGCICRVMCHIVICGMSIYIYIRMQKYNISCDMHRCGKGHESKTVQPFRITWLTNTQGLAPIQPHKVYQIHDPNIFFHVQLTICLFHAKVL